MRRDFTGGTVLVNEPDAPARTVVLGEGFKDLSGTVRTSVTVGPASGVVLVRTGPVTPPVDTETTVTTGPTPTPTATPVSPAPASPPATAPKRASTPAPRPRTKQPSSVRTAARVARVGARVRISGRVRGARAGRVDIVLQRPAGKRRWKTVRRLVAGVGRDGRFARTILAPSGRRRVQARFRGTPAARASRSPFAVLGARRRA
jgi:hypothetical protein